MSENTILMLKSSPLKPEFLSEKIESVRNIMKKSGIDAWVILSREGNEDPLVADLGLSSIVFRAAVVIDADGGATACLGQYDIETLKQRGFYDPIYDYGSQGVGKKLYEVISKTKPKKIAVNISEDFSFADGLSAGMREYLVKSLKEYGSRLVSSEELVIELRGKLIPRELELMKESIRRCEQIYDDAEDFIRIGRKDKEIHDFMKREVQDQGMEVAWDQAPSVAIGRFPGSHLSYVDQELIDGDFLRIDFGVKFEGYCSDIQRVFYLGKGSIPAELQRMFETATKANDACIGILRKGIPGYVADEAARAIVKNAGYPDFMHGTGHPVGRFVHEVGPQIGPRWPDREGGATRKVQSSMIFTVEPSIEGKFGNCNLEQEVLVTENDVLRLSKRQTELIRR
jgi:Xaa-Pro aminopeptidase